MISKERLKELIEQGATICNQYIDYNNNICYRFGKASIIQDNDEQHIELKLNGTNTSVIMYDTKYLFETKAEAEHYLHHANITRTERLPFLTWEEFNEQKFIWFVDNKQNQCCFYYLNVSNKIFLNVSGEVIELGDLTEENFYKAYDECVKLFMGE